VTVLCEKQGRDNNASSVMQKERRKRCRETEVRRNVSTVVTGSSS
jgi:hypothetical protein